MSAVVACILCDLYGGQHPHHPEAPRHGDKEYQAVFLSDAGFQRAIERQLATVRSNCYRKDAYPSRKRAEHYLKWINNPAVHAFFCHECLRWHLGKSEKIGA